MFKTPMGFLAACDNFGMEELQRLSYGEQFKVKITRPRNVKHHRMAFALLKLVFDNQDQFATLVGLLDAIKIGLGHCDERVTLDGEKFYAPRSISFASMDETTFSQFFDRMVNLIIEKILPHTTKEDLERQVFDILGEGGREQLERR